MHLENLTQPGVFGDGDIFDGDEVAMEHVFSFGAKDIGEAAGHTRTKVEAERAEDDDDAAGHIFAAVLADAFDHGESTRIANGEAFTGAPSDEELAGGGAVKDR